MRVVASEEKLTHLIQELPVPLARKLLEFLETLKPELKEDNETKRYERFARTMGAWKDVDTVKIYKNLCKEWKKWTLSA